MLSTERTYRKDLEVISFWLRDEFNKEDDDLQNFEAIDHLLLIIDPIYDAHCVLLREIEIRVSNWDPPYVGDILYNFFENLNLYDRYLEEHSKILEEINALYVSNTKFETLYREFESQKICYLPLTAFILKPLQRLLHYTQILDNLLKYYGKNHAYYEDCYQARLILLNTARRIPNILRKSENLALLYELSRDIGGIDSVYVPEREFIRQGCLSKFSQRKGYQQRMFFLFSDLLLYSARSGHMFRVHGQLPLNNVIIEERPDTPQQHSFSIYGGNRVVTVAASSEEEKDKWLEDLTNAIQKCKIIDNHTNGVDNDSLYYYSLKSCNSSEDIAEKYEDMNKALAIASQRSNKTVYVCWHRNTSISIDDHLRAVENQLSGFLLRKFKNSNGWQKLWVVFTNFCLFFYKSSQEDCPLAGLPLLGYTITTPTEKDGIQKNYAFKLQFKNHIYFFRAESEYTFNRWMEVIGNATQHSGRHRLFSRKESAHLDINFN